METQVSDARLQHIRNSQYQAKLKQVRSEKKKFAREYQSTVHKNEGMLTRLQKDYEVKVSRMKTELDQKLAKLRVKHQKRLESEKAQLDAELANLKKSHQSKVEELKVGQIHQLEEMKESQQRILDQAREKFIRAKAKWQVS
jgi:hypothetical protein